jgi:hypothetical protein
MSNDHFIERLDIKPGGATTRRYWHTLSWWSKLPTGRFSMPK